MSRAVCCDVARDLAAVVGQLAVGSAGVHASQGKACVCRVYVCVYLWPPYVYLVRDMQAHDPPKHIPSHVTGEHVLG